ncbi:chorismate mutase [Desulfotomaculum copahuensis]|uniref:chorismate mutase n=1 Tax=Desulfotomaculum copahuensis TaxID=1838280 RepID=A0A1B7LIN5_9FIRM|nr:chorismate mutase [Desulfotomaculum copahuensis]OAT86435.1 chorismate mutase [Desulfotomaculum copahuensis]
MGKTFVRAIRGAITVERNRAEDILEATGELLRAIVKENDLCTEDIASAFFTVTADLNAEFPAAAARELLGWQYVPLLCAREIDVPGRLGRCIRVLVHVNTERSQREIKHIYLREATKLRTDLLPQ